MGKDKIFHVCRCAGLQHTDEEYVAWVRTHDTCEVMAEHNGYQFSYRDVCLNPKIVAEWSDSLYSFGVRLAQSANGRWSYGLSGNNLGVFATWLPKWVSEPTEGYENINKCVFAALQALETAFNKKLTELLDGPQEPDENHYGEPAPKTKIASIREALKQIRIYKVKYDPRQLTLFD